ncbi:MAG TPA: chemotaxis protein CheD, partial [Sphingomicrobium sp.]
MRRISIIQGESAVVSEPNTIITTLLGSCVSVCMHDNVAHVGGMNHFLLGEPSTDKRLTQQDMQHYGVHAMELLINALMKKGAARSRLRAHIYGGATIIAGLGGIGSSNAAFARSFMEMEGITVGHVDVGGTHARKVEFMPYDGKARSTAVNDRPPIAVLPQPAVTG